MKAKKTFLAGAGMLAASVVFAKILGAAYRIPLANIVGARGMGVYQFVYPLFALLLTLSCGALPTAVSISVSDRLSRGDADGARQFFGMIIRLALIIGLIGSGVLIAVAYPLSLMQSRDAFIGYVAIAPAVLIVTLISAFRGWFMGNKNMTPNAVSQITEGIVKLGVGLTLAKLLLPYGLKYASAGALLGVVASEFVTLIILFAVFLKQEKRFVKVKLRSQGAELKPLWMLAVPLIIGGLILPLSQFIDSLLLVNLLRFSGMGAVTSTETYGLWTGAVMPLINLPVMVCISLGIAITPQMVEGRVKRDVDFIMDKCATATKLTLVLGVPFVFLFLFMSEGFVGALFPRIGALKISQGADMLKISSVSVIFLSLFQIYSAMLQGLNKAMVPVKVMSVCILIKTGISVVSVPYIGITGGVIGSVVGYSLAGIFVMLYFFSYVRGTGDLLKNASLITLCGVIMGVMIMFLARFANGVTKVVSISAGGFVIYAIALFILRVFSSNELKSMPLGKMWVRLDGAIHKKKLTNDN